MENCLDQLCQVPDIPTVGTFPWGGGGGEAAQNGDFQSVRPSKAIAWEQDGELSLLLQAEPASAPKEDSFDLSPLVQGS